MRLKLALVALIATFGSARGAYAQGCALCYTTASAAGAAAQRSLDYGILALVTPALVMFLFVIYLLFRRTAAASV